MTEPTPQTLLDRLVAAGISDARAKIEGGHVRAGDDILTDPDMVWPWPRAFVLV